MGQPDQGHLEVHPGVRGVAHGDLGLPEDLHGPDQGGQAHPPGPGGQIVPLASGYRHQIRCHQGQKALPQVVDQIAGELLGTEAGRRQVGHRHQGPPDVPLGQGLDHLVELGQVVVDRVRSHHLVEDREGVAGRAPAPPHRQVQGLVGHLQVGVTTHLVQQLAQGLRARAGGTRSAGYGS